MKNITKLIRIISCIVFLAGVSLTAQVKNEKINTNTAISKEKITPKKISKWNFQLNKINFDGEYVLFESDLYAEHLKRKRVSLKNKKAKKISGKSKKSTSKSKSEMHNIDKELVDINQNLTNYKYSLTGNDCGESISDDLCDKIKNAIRIEVIEEEEVPRDCPDETNPHCLPIHIHKNLKYVVIPKTIEKFNAVFYSKQGVKIGAIGKPLFISGDNNHLAYPIELQKDTGDMIIKVYTYGSNIKKTYKAAISMKDF